MTSRVVKAIKTIWQDYPFRKDRVTFEIISKTDLESGFNPKEMLDSNLILFDVHGLRISAPTQPGFDFEVLKEVIDRGPTVLAVGEKAGLDSQYAAIGITSDKEIRSYLRYSNTEKASAN